VQRAEGTDNRIKTRIGVAKIFRISNFELSSGESPPSFVNHVLRDVGANSDA
jgi:hypothetical protein